MQTTCGIFPIENEGLKKRVLHQPWKIMGCRGGKKVLNITFSLKIMIFRKMKVFYIPLSLIIVGFGNKRVLLCKTMMKACAR
jgi:hypothetical protein